MTQQLSKSDLRDIQYILDKMGGNRNVQKKVLTILLNDSSMNSTIKGFMKSQKQKQEENLTPKQQVEKEESMRPVYDAKRDTLIKSLGGITTGNPLLDFGIRVGAVGASQASKAAGLGFQNNGNQLAAALLSGKRTSQSKEDKFGKTFDSIGRDIAASERIRRGNNIKYGLDALGNTIAAAGQMFGAPLDAAGMMTAGQATDLPGHAYNWMNGTLSRASKASKNLGI